MDNTRLVHWGIKGMKWGRRRYQNKDGTLTPEGKKRQQIKGDKQTDRARKKEMRRDVRRRRLLTDAEIDQKIKRLEKEKKLRELTDEEINRGRKAVGEVLGDSGKKVAKSLVTGATLYGVKYAMTRKFDPTDAAGYVAPKPKNK